MEKNLKLELQKNFTIGKIKRYKGEVYCNVNKNGNETYWKDGMFPLDGKLHRDDGPAIILANGNKAWFKEGKLHRLDGPAIEYADDEKYWFIDDVQYTEEEYKDKIKMMEFQKDPKWKSAFYYGELKHYKDEIYCNINEYGNKIYWKNGLIHRDGGPAIEYKNGDKSWYIEGIKYSEEEFNHKIKMVEIEKDPKWKQALYYGELKHYKDDIYYNVDEFGNKRYWKDGNLHRDDGPAVEWKDGTKSWWKEDKRHRLDGPAVEWEDGRKFWYIEGIKYSEEEYNHKIKMVEIEKDPNWKYALRFGELKHYKDDVYYNVDQYGNKRYWKDGNYHRDDGPAVEYVNGNKEWYKEDKYHRLDGPAIKYKNGSKGWFIEGEEYSEEEYNHKIKMMEIEKDPKWKQALHYGELKHYKDEIYCNVSQYGNKIYWKNGLMHRDDGPALECADGTNYWFIEDKRHRLDGPAVECADGTNYWYIEGINYTEKEYNHKIKMMEFKKDPKWQFALTCGELKHYKDNVYYNEDKYGNKSYWKDGKSHRDDGPAIIVTNGHKEWVVDGNHHRLDGPALEFADGTKNWYIKGVEYTEEEYNHKIKMMEMEKDSKWEFAFRFGELKHYKDEIYYNVDIFGSKRYWKKGKLHRDDGPAIEYSDGTKEWYIEGESDPKWKFALNYGDLKHYKDDIYYSVSLYENIFYWKDGNIHRDDGPAIEYSDGSKLWYKEGKNHRLDGPAKELAGGDKYWYIEGKEYTEEGFNQKININKMDGIYSHKNENGDIFYYKNNKRHNENGPASIFATGEKEWYKEGKLHRLDGPAFESETLNIYSINGIILTEQEFLEFKKIKDIHHNYYHSIDIKDDLLVINCCNNDGDEILYFKDGKLHNLNGPAVISETGSYFFIDGKQLSPEQFEAYKTRRDLAIRILTHQSKSITKKFIAKHANVPPTLLELLYYSLGISLSSAQEEHIKDLSKELRVSSLSEIAKINLPGLISASLKEVEQIEHIKMDGEKCFQK